VASAPPCLGILMLDGAYLTVPGAVGNPETFDLPAEYRTVGGATGELVAGHHFSEAAPGYEAAARGLAADGATALVSNCGFAVVYQDGVRETTGLPTALSSLLLVPLLARVYGDRFAILTFDKSQLDDQRRAASGWPAGLEVPIADVVERPSWAALDGPDGTELDISAMRRDLLAIVEEVLNEHVPQALLLECTGFSPFVPEVENLSRLPVYDIVALTRFLFVPRGSGVK
jgi:hypothetical protein